MTPSRDISRLIEIMAALRTPVTGCPWDLEQNFATIAPYTIEEAYEVADAITRGDFDDLREELGDLLLQVVYHARMAEEQNAFAFGDVVEAITRKMIRRHPHVFADKDGNIAPAGVKSAWERIKAEEKAERAARRPPEETTHKSLLSGIKAGQPALTRAMELQRKASTVGFDWNDPRAVLSKIREEADEIEAALDGGDAERTRRRNRRPPVRAGQPGPPCRRRSRNRAARHQRQVRAPLRLYRACARGEGPLARGRITGRDGRAVERGEGCGTADRADHHESRWPPVIDRSGNNPRPRTATAACALQFAPQSPDRSRRHRRPRLA